MPGLTLDIVGYSLFLFIQSGINIHTLVQNSDDLYLIFGLVNFIKDEVRFNLRTEVPFANLAII